jgi:hypothetical protein
VQVFFGNVPDVVELVQSGKRRWLGISTAQRISLFRDVPTVAETVPGFVMTGGSATSRLRARDPPSSSTLEDARRDLPRTRHR